jgi:sulfur-oxidizing protein SoxA
VKSKAIAVLSAGGAAVALAWLVVAPGVLAEPVDESLSIDGEEITVVAPAPTEPAGHPFDQVMSGWLYREPDTREMEADSFENPGMLNVERGAQIWNAVEGTEGQSCAACHGDAAESMAGVGATYPKWSASAGQPVDLEMLINQHRVEKMGAEPYKFDVQDQKDLVAFVKYQSLGVPVEIDLSEGEMMDWWQKGKDRYYLRTGQLNLACASCHEANSGQYLRADHLSQGQTNGFPTYRLKQANLVSIMNRFRGCVRDTRAEQPEAFSDELVALEVYTAWRGENLSVETPAVRQ